MKLKGKGKMNLPKETHAWLMEAPEPYIRYQALCLLSPDEADPALLDCRSVYRRKHQDHLRMEEGRFWIRHDKPDLFRSIVWPCLPIWVSQKSSKGVGRLVDALLDNIDEDGFFLINISIPKAFGGSGSPSREWIICDFPVTLYALLRMGVQDDRLTCAVDKLIHQCRVTISTPAAEASPNSRGPAPGEACAPMPIYYVAPMALSASPEGKTIQGSGPGGRRGAWPLVRPKREKIHYLFGMAPSLAAEESFKEA